MAVALSMSLEDVLEEFSLSREQLNLPCSLLLCNNLAAKLDRWELLAPHIGLSQCDIIDITEDSSSYQDQRLSCFRKWRNRYGSKATVISLVEALSKIKRYDLVGDLCKLYKQEPETSADLFSSSNKVPAEYKCLLSYRDELISEISCDLPTVSGKLLKKDLIPSSLTIVNPREIDDLQLASKIVDCLLKRVKFFPDKYYVLRDVLHECSWMNDLVKQLSEITRTESREQVDPDIREAIQLQLKHNLDQILTQYALYVSYICESVKKKKKPVDNLRTFLLNLPALKYRIEEEEHTLLAGKRDKLNDQTTINGIFDLISEECASFLNYGLFESIAKKYKISGKSDDMQYPKHIQVYLNSHKISEFVQINPLLGSMNDSSKRALAFKFDIKLTERVSKIMSLKQCVADVLGLNILSLELVDVSKGCVLVTFLVPKHIADNIERTFTSKQKKSEFQALRQQQQLHALKVILVKVDDTILLDFNTDPTLPHYEPDSRGSDYSAMLATSLPNQQTADKLFEFGDGSRSPSPGLAMDIKVDDSTFTSEGKSPPVQSKIASRVTHTTNTQVNGIQCRETPVVSGSPLAATSSIAAEPGLPTTSEGMEEEEEKEEEEIRDWTNEMSAEAQAHNISMFLSSSASDSEEQVTEFTVITSVYRDPLEFCMEGIEEMARKILRTGKLTINGEPGDMGKIQPALFNLQASEKELAQLLPQLLQVAFFSPGNQQQQDQIFNFPDVWNVDSDETFLNSSNMDEALANGNIRIAIPLDAAIYALLRNHCAKGARQANEVINVAMTPLNSHIPLPTGPNISKPPIVKFRSTPRPVHQWGNREAVREDGSGLPTSSTLPAVIRWERNQSSLSLEDWSESSHKVSTQSSLSVCTSNTHSTSSSSRSENSASTLINSDEASLHTLQDLTSSSEQTINEEPVLPEGTPKKTPLSKTLSQNKVRRNSKAYERPMTPRRQVVSRTVSLESDILVESTYVPNSSLWNTGIMDNNTMVAQYGSQPYPIVWWDPEYKIDFRLSTSVGTISGTVTGIDPSKPEVTLKVFNNSPKQVGFAIRSHRQSTLFSSHVVYPTKGLELLEPYKSWEDNVQFLPNSTSTTEMFVTDLFFCTMDGKPVWNVVRKYAIMKAEKSASQLRKASKRRMSHFQLPGSRESKAEHIELVLSHGLQCVVKGKINEAEIIFSQALFLPDFQRVPIKSFLYICLGVLASKRIKQGNASSLVPVLICVESASKLVSICEQGPGSVKMPYIIQLVKQLRKELNVEKLVKEKLANKKAEQSVRKSSNRMDDKVIMEFKQVMPEGAELSFDNTTVTIPPDALTQETSVTLSLANSKQLIPMLKASGWEKIVKLATAIHVDCNPSIDHFSKPIKITTKLPEESKVEATSLVRLMHSNYLRHWEDITDDILSKIAIRGDEVSIETNLTGWLAVSVIHFNPSMIAQMVLKSISIEPVLMRFSVFGYIDTEQKSIQVVVSAVPCTSSEEPLHRDMEKPSENISPISFPHVVQAYPNEKLRLEILGNFEPDASHGEDNLSFDMVMQQKHNQILSKWIKSTAPPEAPLCGKLKVSLCRNSTNSWESIAHIGLSMRSGCIRSQLTQF